MGLFKLLQAKINLIQSVPLIYAQMLLIKSRLDRIFGGHFRLCVNINELLARKVGSTLENVLLKESKQVSVAIEETKPTLAKKSKLLSAIKGGTPVNAYYSILFFWDCSIFMR